MGILKRFKEIMSANINEKLDQMEDPGKMADQTIRNLEKDLMVVKTETAAVMATEKAAKRDLEKVENEIVELRALAEKAVRAGNDDDAAKLLVQKEQLLRAKAESELNYSNAKENAAKIRAMHDKLQSDIQIVNNRRAIIKGKMAVAKTQEHLNRVINNATEASNSFSAFDRWEAKANARLDAANAMTELNTTVDDIEQIRQKYAAVDASDERIKDELNEIKVKISSENNASDQGAGA